MRTKEDAADYRYFPDPDLPPLVIAAEWIERVRGEMPELPRVMAERFERDYALNAYDAALLVQSRTKASFFEKTIEQIQTHLVASNPAKWRDKSGSDAQAMYRTTANSIGSMVATQLNKDGIDIQASPVSAVQLAILLTRLIEEVVNAKTAREIFAEMWTLRSADHNIADQIIESKGLKQMSDTGELDRILDEVLAANAKSVEEYRAGKDKAFNALIGQAMKATKGKANPAAVNELLKKKLSV